MANKKKGGRVKVALICTETNTINGFTVINKSTTPKLELMKYCKKLRKHTLHKSREKLK